MAGPLGKLAFTLPFGDARTSVELAKRAEQDWGYEAIWMAETAGPDSFTLAGAILQATRTLTLGTAIVPVYNRTPAVLAMSAGTLGQLAPGRFRLGLGSSSHAIIGDWNGVPFEVPFEAPLSTVRDSVAIIRQALAGEKTSYDGKRLRSKGLRLGCVPPEPVPIYLAGLREKMLNLAGEIGEGLIINFQPVEAMAQILSAYQAGAAAAGRDATGDEVVSRFQFAVTDDVPAARNIVRAGFGGYLAQPVYNKFIAWCGFEEEARAIREGFARRDRQAVGEAIHDELIDRIVILGNEDVCREKLAGFVAAGVTTPVLAPLAARKEDAVRMLEAFAPARSG
ncbi:MAG: LLM class F420-dependent oxidoreductase [Deltaproteobacteria bacterium]|nr:LLM class F420-dependent oxidoreductase [Deltaproteobacteria bacterium]